MPRLRDIIQLKNIKIEEIKTDMVPLVLTLKESLLEIEQKDPIKVREYVNGTYQYEIVDGRRRLKALYDSGETNVLALVIKNMDDTELSINALVGNSGQPNPMDEAYHMANLKEQGYTGEQIAKVSGYSQSRISLTLKLLSLIPELQLLLSKGEMKFSAGYEAAKLPKDKQLILLEKFNNGQAPTHKFIFEEVRNYQAEKVSLFNLNNNIEVKPGLFLNSDEVEGLLNGETIIIDWEGHTLRLSDTVSIRGQ